MARPHPAHIITDDSAIGGKVIEKSVRCDLGSNAYFTRTSDEAGDRRTFTLSGWYKFYRTETGDVGQDFIFYSGTSLNEQFQLSRRVFLKLILNLKIAEAPPLDFIQRRTFVIIHGIISF